MVAQIIRMEPNKEASFVELTPEEGLMPLEALAPPMMGLSGTSDSIAAAEARMTAWVAAAPAQPAARTLTPTPAPGTMPTATATPEKKPTATRVAAPATAWAAALTSPR